MADIRSTPEEDGWGETTLKTVLLGDFYKPPPTPTFSGLAMRAVFTSVPVLDQLADAQDIAAWIILCRDSGIDDLEVKIGGLLLGIGLIPAIGSAGKGVLKTITSSAGAKAIVEILEKLNFLGQGNGVKWLKEFAGELPSHAKKAAELISGALAKLQQLLGELTPHVPARLEPKLAEWIASVSAIQAQVSKMFKEAADHCKKKLDEALGKFKKEELEVASSTQKQASRKQSARKIGDGTGAADTGKVTPAELDGYVMDKYGQHVSPEKAGGTWAQDHLHQLDEDGYRDAFIKDGGNPADFENVHGFCQPDTCDAFVAADRPYSAATSAHETFHSYSSPEWKDAANRGFDEGVTQHFEQRAAGDLGLAFNSEESYTGSQWLAERVVRKVGSDTVADAYFGGNVGGLKDAWNSSVSKSENWDNLLKQFDSKYAKDVGR